MGRHPPQANVQIKLFHSQVHGGILFFSYAQNFINLITLLIVMKRGEKNNTTVKTVLITVVIIFAVLFLLPFMLLLIFSSANTQPSFGNIAIIPVKGPILTTAPSGFGAAQVASSEEIILYLEDAAQDSSIDAIILEINSPGGSAVASDEIGTVIKQIDKPVVAQIREVGASGGYWIASASDHIVAHRMAITGSIGVISSYLEFSGLMEEYGVGYERLVAGNNKDIGTPFKQLSNKERTILQEKLDTIHDYFIQEVAENRDLSQTKVREVATGEFYLGVEALELGLIDELGNLDTVEAYLSQQHDIKRFEYVIYESELTLFDALFGVFNNFFFSVGKGIGSELKIQEQYNIMV